MLASDLLDMGRDFVGGYLRQEHDPYNCGHYMGFIMGVQQMGEAAGEIGTLPSGVTPKQVGMVVLNYLTDNPADLHLPAALLVYSALNGAWPAPPKELPAEEDHLKGGADLRDEDLPF